MAAKASSKSRKPTARLSSSPARERTRSGPRSARSGHDGKGFNVDLIALPVTGRLVIRERKEAS
jgi:hypothetical protein